MSNMTKNPSTIAVFGLGYVGCVTAACLADLGHKVIGVDTDPGKVSNVIKGQAPFYEPGLESLVSSSVKGGFLTATTSTTDAIQQADIALLCVGTPSEKTGNLGLDQLRRVVTNIAAELSGRTKPLIVAVRSTVFPGTCEEIVESVFAGNNLVSVVSNPEFLREGTAVKDFREPSIIVVGGSDPAAVGRAASIYDALGVPPCLVSLRTAEMIKYACNAFHAVKITFANEIGSLATRMGISAEEVMETLCQDDHLNISKAYLKPGFAFGGSCLPKDLRALNYRASRLDVKLPMLFSVLASNDEHLRRAIDGVIDLGNKKLGIFGLAFKENTDDLRESPVVTMLEYLIGKGRDMKVFDPHIQIDTIYGSNRHYILNAVPHIGKLMVGELEEMLAWADNIVIAQKPSPEISAKIRATGKPVIDLVRSGTGDPV